MILILNKLIKSIANGGIAASIIDGDTQAIAKYLIRSEVGQSLINDGASRTLKNVSDDITMNMIGSIAGIPIKKSILQRNLAKLTRQLIEINDLGLEKVLFIGQPGAGKSSLIRNLTNKECIPLPDIGQKTDLTNWAEELKKDLTISYKNIKIVDAPGYDTNDHKVYTYLNRFPFNYFSKINIVFSNKIHNSDLSIINRICEAQMRKNLEVNIIRCFSENLEEEDYDLIIDDINDKINQVIDEQNTLDYTLYFFSNRTKEGIDELKKVLL